MHFLIPLTSILLIIIIALVSGRSVSHQSESEKNSADSSKKFIFLESPVEPGAAEKLQLEGKNFSGKNSLDEDWKKRSEHGSEASQEPFTLVVPVARNFSSLKELFDILREDSGKPAAMPPRMTNQSYVKGSETSASDYVIFFTS